MLSSKVETGSVGVTRVETRPSKEPNFLSGVAFKVPLRSSLIQLQHWISNPLVLPFTFSQSALGEKAVSGFGVWMVVKGDGISFSSP